MLLYNIGMKVKSILFLLLIILFALWYKFFSITSLQDSRRVDGIVEPVFTQDCFPRTLQQNGVTKLCFEHANLGQDIFCTTSQLEKIKDYYKRGQDKDPLNDGSDNFCAD